MRKSTKIKQIYRPN